MNDEQQIWELRRGDEILGRLATNDWLQDPWIGCELRPAPAYKKYMALFDTCNRKPRPPLDWQSTESGLAIPATGSYENLLRWNEYNQEIKEQIKALNLSLVPISPNAYAGRVSEIVVDGKSVEMIAEFDHYDE